MNRSAVLAVAVLACACFTLQASATFSHSGRFDVVFTSDGIVNATDLGTWKGNGVETFINVSISKISKKVKANVTLLDDTSFQVTWAKKSGRGLLTSFRLPVFVEYYGITSDNETVRGTVLVKSTSKGVSTADVETATFSVDFSAKVTKTLNSSSDDTVLVTVADINSAIKPRTFNSHKTKVVLANFTDVDAVHHWKVEAELVDPTTFSVTIEDPWKSLYITPIAVSGTTVNGTDVDGFVYLTIRKPKVKGL